MSAIKASTLSSTSSPPLPKEGNDDRITDIIKEYLGFVQIRVALEWGSGAMRVYGRKYDVLQNSMIDGPHYVSEYVSLNLSEDITSSGRLTQAKIDIGFRHLTAITDLVIKRARVEGFSEVLFSGGGTAAFRKATNRKEVEEAINKTFPIRFRTLTQDDEGILGMATAMTLFEPDLRRQMGFKDAFDIDKSDFIFENPPAGFASTLRISSALIIAKGHILFLQRAQDKPHGLTWGLPGGKCTQEESEREGATRETREETGIDVSIALATAPSKYYARYPDNDFLYHMFECSFDDFPKVTLNPNEHIAYRWAPIQQAFASNKDFPLIPGMETCMQHHFGRHIGRNIVVLDTGNSSFQLISGDLVYPGPIGHHNVRVLLSDIKKGAPIDTATKEEVEELTNRLHAIAFPEVPKWLQDKLASGQILIGTFGENESIFAVTLQARARFKEVMGAKDKSHHIDEGVILLSEVRETVDFYVGKDESIFKGLHSMTLTCMIFLKTLMERLGIERLHFKQTLGNSSGILVSQRFWE